MAMTRTRERTRAILEMMEQGMTNDQIGEALDIHPVTVARTGLRRDLNTVRGMFNMIDAGYTLQEIGKHFGVTKQRVAQIVGGDEDRGSRGKKVTLDVAAESWDGFMQAIEDMGITVYARPGIVDSRAVAEFIDRVADGQITMKMPRIRGGRRVKEASTE